MRFIKYIPDSEISIFLESKPLTNHLAMIIAKRARRTKCDLKKLDAGECFLGDFKKIGLTEQQYRTAKKHLENIKFATFRTTTIITAGVTKRVTVAKLVNTDVWDINENYSNGTNNGTINGTNNVALTVNNNDKNDNKKEEQEKYIYLGEFRKIKNGELIRTTELEKHFDFSLFPKEWSENLQDNILKFWRYLESKKGHNWGNVGTISSQLGAIKSYYQNFSEVEIIEAFDYTILNGNVHWNPEWTKKKKESTSPKIKADYTPPYKIPEFENENQRFMFFFARFEKYRPHHPDRSFANTKLKDRALMKKEAEQVCYELEQQYPELLKYAQ